MSNRRKLAVLCAAGIMGTIPASASAATRVVYAGGTAKFEKSLGVVSVDNFITNKVTIHVGDTVKWDGASLAGGFHDVDIPKLNGEDLPLITTTGKNVSGVKDETGSDFWFNGKVPVVGFNTVLFGRSGPKAYNGTTRIDSGLPVGPGPHNFAVKFLTAGTYKYFCDVHPGMVGYVIVKPKSQPIPSQAAVAAQLRKEQAKYAAEAEKVVKTKVPANSVSLGQSGPGGVEAFAMFPASLTVTTGTTVRFFMATGSREIHTATFGPNKYLMQLSASFQGPAPDPRSVYPSDPPGHILLTDTSHGNGFANTGVLDQDPSTPQPAAGTITFSKPGTYHFICVVHPFMHGTIIVK